MPLSSPCSNPKGGTTPGGGGVFDIPLSGWLNALFGVVLSACSGGHGGIAHFEPQISVPVYDSGHCFVHSCTTDLRMEPDEPDVNL